MDSGRNSGRKKKKKKSKKGQILLLFAFFMLLLSNIKGKILGVSKNKLDCSNKTLKKVLKSIFFAGKESSVFCAFFKVFFNVVSAGLKVIKKGGLGPPTVSQGVLVQRKKTTTTKHFCSNCAFCSN